MMQLDSINVIIIAAIITAVGGIIAVIVKFIMEKSHNPIDDNPKISSKTQWITIFPSFPNKDQLIGDQYIFVNLKKLLLSSKGARILINGIPGIGKKFICRLLCNELQAAGYFNNIGIVSCKGNDSLTRQIGRQLLTNNSRKHLRSTNDLINYFSELSGSTLIFVTDIPSQEKADELEFLTCFPDTSIVITSCLRDLKIGDLVLKKYSVSPLDDIDSQKLFEAWNPLLEGNKKLKKLLRYTHGIPLLVKAMANTIKNTNDITHFTKKLEAEGFNAIKDIEIVDFVDGMQIQKKMVDLLATLFNVNTMNHIEKEVIGKLSVFGHLEFTNQFCDWFNIDYHILDRLWLRHWLDKSSIDDEILYTMPDVQQDVAEILGFKKSLDALITDALRFFNKDENSWCHFRNFASYAEKIRVLSENNGYINKTTFHIFACFVAIDGYDLVLRDSKQARLWVDSFTAVKPDLQYSQAFRALRALRADADLETINKLSDDAKKIVVTGDFSYEIANDYLNNVETQTIRYLFGKLSNKALLKRINAFLSRDDITLEQRIKAWDLFLKIYIEDEAKDSLSKILKKIPKEISESKSRYSMWLCFRLVKAYSLLDDHNSEKAFHEKGVIIGNLVTGFCSEELKSFINMSDGEFAKYMHSSESLRQNFEECIKREMPEALYIKGRYLEANGFIEDAIEAYISAKNKDSIRAWCALGNLYFEGKLVERNLDKAEAFWKFGDKRDHAGSAWGLYQLYYEIGDTARANTYLRRASMLGSKKADAHLERDAATNRDAVLVIH